MHLYVLIQNVYGIEHCGIRHWLEKPEILEQYQVGHYRLSLVAAPGSWGPEGRLEDWRRTPLSNLIAWERVS